MGRQRLKPATATRVWTLAPFGLLCWPRRVHDRTGASRRASLDAVETEKPHRCARWPASPPPSASISARRAQGSRALWIPETTRGARHELARPSSFISPFGSSSCSSLSFRRDVADRQVRDLGLAGVSRQGHGCSRPLCGRIRRRRVLLTGGSGPEGALRPGAPAARGGDLVLQPDSEELGLDLRPAAAALPREAAVAAVFALRF